MQEAGSDKSYNENSRITAALSRLTGPRSPGNKKQGQQSIEPNADQGDSKPSTHKTVQLFSWVCSSCQRECVPIRSESRCLCGHRLKEHNKPTPTSACRCNHAKCPCKSFFFIPAEGSWILRCRCKHRHTDHDPHTHACSKSSCVCSMFCSPWVCNCNHAWSHHKQVMVTKQVPTVEGLLAGTKLSDANVLAELLHPEAGLDVNRWDLINRGNAA